jgi:ribA/ribD-fused uncharacterized protein
MRNVVKFYRTGDEYGCFSNFAAYPVQLKRRIWPTSEHFFQAQKFAGTEHEEAIRLAESPTIAARMGRDRSKPLRHDWEHVKDETMRSVVVRQSYAITTRRAMEVPRCVSLRNIVGNLYIPFAGSRRERR